MSKVEKLDDLVETLGTSEFEAKKEYPTKEFSITNDEHLKHIAEWISKIAEVTDGKAGTFSYIFKENYDTNTLEVFVHSEKINFTKKLQ